MINDNPRLSEVMPTATELRLSRALALSRHERDGYQLLWRLALVALGAGMVGLYSATLWYCVLGE